VALGCAGSSPVLGTIKHKETLQQQMFAGFLFFTVTGRVSG